MRRILVVEDSPTVLHVTSKALIEGGYEVVKATNGDDALRLAAQTRPDLVLLDLILPRLNGYQVCRHLKSMEQTAHIPVVMITSKNKESDRQWGLDQGADFYLTKPFRHEDLLSVVSQFIEGAVQAEQ